LDCNHVLDKLKSYGAAKKEIMLGVEHRQHKGLNNRASVLHGEERGEGAPIPR
jgi:putative transposase